MALNHDSPINVVKDLLRRLFPLQIRSIPRRIAGVFEDFLLGIRCEGWHYHTEADRMRMQGSDGNMYQPITYRILRKVSSSIQLGGKDVLFDLGCGKGRVVAYFASKFVLKRVVGVEFVHDLAEIAKNNIQRIRGRSPATIICQDVANSDFSEGTIFFNYQAFGPKTTALVLEKIRASLEKNPRIVTIICINKSEQDLYHGSGWLRLIKEDGGRIFIWSNSLSQILKKNDCFAK